MRFISNVRSQMQTSSFVLNGYSFLTCLQESALALSISWDLSFGGSSAGSSWVVGQVWGIVEANKYLLHMTREQMGFADTLASIQLMDKLYEADEILIENKANGPATIKTLTSEIGYRLKALEPGGSKSDRAYAVVPQFERGEVWLLNPKGCVAKTDVAGAWHFQYADSRANSIYRSLMIADQSS